MMTFPEQIKNIPMSVVQQGWRWESPQSDIRLQWMRRHHSNGWESHMHFIGGEWKELCRPTIATSTPLVVWTDYAHQGWAEGLAPTPDMVKVWKFWWKDMGGLLVPIGVADSFGEMFPEYQRNLGQGWRGPVLPPVRTT